jgi:membrane protein YqaA with SNARE-associated domain
MLRSVGSGRGFSPTAIRGRERRHRLLATFLGTFGYCFLSALIPVLNAEIYLLGASALVPPALAPVLIVSAALGQMVGKSLLYFAGRGALKLPAGRLRTMVDGVHRKYDQGGAAAPALGATVVLVSAGTGIPPFYVVTVACGIFRVPFVNFLLLGFVGMLGRFSVVVLAPQLIKSL